MILRKFRISLLHTKGQSLRLILMGILRWHVSLFSIRQMMPQTLHGFPRSIVSPRSLLGTKLLFSTTCHPQIDGLTKIINHKLSTLLCAMIKKYLKYWEESLPHVEFVYNRVVNSTTSHSPFEVVYGFNLLTYLDMISLSMNKQVHQDGKKKAKYVRQLHEKGSNKLRRKLDNMPTKPIEGARKYLLGLIIGFESI
ncbi:hypothetical protein CR513_38637, partial [Mucuna pruriens]